MSEKTTRFVVLPTFQSDIPEILTQYIHSSYAFHIQKDRNETLNSTPWLERETIFAGSCNSIFAFRVDAKVKFELLNREIRKSKEHERGEEKERAEEAKGVERSSGRTAQKQQER